MGSYVAAPPAHRAQEDRHGNEPLTNGQGHGSRAPAFSFVCLGVGGGPLETNCSGYLMKPADQPWSAGTTLVEAGSWLGSLVELLRDPATSPLHDADFPPGLSPEAQAEHVNAWVNQALISHGHLDHIFGLVLASTAQRVQRPVYGLQDTLDTILSVFNGRVWPKLASYDQQDPMAFYHLRPMELEKKYKLSDVLSVTPYPVSHGMSLLAHDTAGFRPIIAPNPTPCSFHSGHISSTVSTAFLFTHTVLDCDVLFMGDVEPDAVGGSQRNQAMWQAIAPRVAQGKLRAIFIECSFGSDQPNEYLFGHLTPRHLYDELRALEDAGNAVLGDIEAGQCLAGMKCVVIHVKDMMLPSSSTPPCRLPANTAPEAIAAHAGAPKLLPVDLRAQIQNELAVLEEKYGLGVEFHVARRGDRIEC